MTIKDSGTRRQFDSGAVRDMQEGKGRCDLLPACAILRNLIDIPTRPEYKATEEEELKKREVYLHENIFTQYISPEQLKRHVVRSGGTVYTQDHDKQGWTGEEVRE